MVETGTYTPETDENASGIHISHSLGVVPDFVLVIADAFQAIASDANKYIANSSCAKTNLIASNVSKTGFAVYMTNFNGMDTSWQTFEYVDHTKFLHESSFEVPYYSSSDKLKAGITYHYVIGSFE